MDIAQKTCAICRLGHIDEHAHGDWKKADNLDIHLFCLLLSTDLPQRGVVDEAIGITSGFLLKDILDYTKLRSRKKCRYCKKKYASVRCAQKNCQTWWHVSCGYENKCLPTFEGEFRSYCKKHVEIKEEYEIHEDFWQCQMCKESMGPYHPVTSIPSCCNQGSYHRKCMQVYTNIAGLLAKCPSCGEDAEGYRKFLSKRGIFCPEKDADWELVDDAYGYLSKKWSKCTAAKCLCPHGIEHAGESSWFFDNCQFCGANGVHNECREDDAELFTCIDCTTKSQSQLLSQQQTLFTMQADDSDTSYESMDDEEDGEQSGFDLSDVSKMAIDDEEHQSNVSNHSDNNNVSPEISPCSRQQAEASKVEKKVWKLVMSNMTKHRSHSLTLVDSNDTSYVDPLGDNERAKMRNIRLETFFESADFSVKPPPLPWLI